MPERWYVPTRAGFQRELLTMVGIKDDQIVDADEHPHVQADVLVVPGLPANMVLNPPWVVEYLRGRLLPTDVTLGPPIYVTRGNQRNNRRIVNEAQVRAELEQRGFAFVDPGAMSVAEQIRAFAAAPVIVGAHGAGLANIMFARSGAAVVELFPGGAVLPDCYWTLARGVPGLRYRYLVAPGGSSRRDYNPALVSDIDVDLGALRRLLDGLSEPAGAA
jgi:capsular polysaccharide biosynthesis protein